MEQNFDHEHTQAMNADIHPDDVIFEDLFPSDADLEYPTLVAQDSEVTTEELVAAEENTIPDELLWQARTGLNPDTLCGAIETIIFMSDKPVSIQKIKALIDEDMPLKVIHEALQRLQAEYEEKHHGLRLLEVAEGYQYRTKATYSKYVQDIFKINSLVLSPTALEVLAIIAYKQPVSKVEVDKIRGVDSGHIVRALMDKRLVRVTGRSDELGRPVLYGTTSEFLEVFNLPELSALPPEHELDEMSRVSTVGKIADIKTLVHDGDKARFKFDEIDELDQLSESIKNIASDTDFTSSLKVEEKKRMSEEGAEIKSAFDLLEEFVNKRLITEQNKMALTSMLTTNVIEPKIIDDLEAGPFNTPEVDDEEEFQMIDLDTGLPLDEDYDSGLSEDEFDIIVDLDFDKEESEEEALSKALDAAFSNLTGETLESRLSDDEFAMGGEIEEKTQELDELTQSMIGKAQDLDLDLSFLNDGISKEDNEV
jgi:segregation and condensation protein B